MKFNHTSVLLKESIEGLNIKKSGIYVDGTLGGGGHSLEICKALGKEGKLIAVDRDMDAIKAAKKNLENTPNTISYIQSNYSDIKKILSTEGVEGIDGGLLDLGVSSFQLDSDHRGFSYMQNAPLDMRMNQSDLLTAEEIVNTYSQENLTRIIKTYGEERWANRISQFITRERKKEPIRDTETLVRIIKEAIPAGARREGPHPAKRTFQAIRIEVNEELEQLKNAIEAFCDVLNTGGRMVVITFHSLEDRIVKEIFARRTNPCTCPKGMVICNCQEKADIKKITRKPIIPSEEEIEVNPRARSAKLRIIEKL